MKIFLDSNIIIADYNLSSPYFQVLESFLRRTNSSLFVPLIVLEEVKSKYREDLLQASRKFWDALKRLYYLEWSLQSERSKWPSEFEIPSPADNPLLDVERKVEGYFNYLESRLKLIDAQRPDYPTVPHARVAERAITRRKPFSEAGKGYKDTIIWETILAEAASDSEEIVFITNNTKDFSAQGSACLHDDLKHDLKTSGISEERVTLYTSVESFVNSFVAPRLKRLDDLEKQLSEGAFASLSLQKLLEDREEEVTSVINNELPDLLDEPRFDEPSVVGLYHPAQIDSVVVYENDKTTLFVQFGANIDVDVEFFIEKGDYYVLDEEQDDFSIYDPDWNEWVMRGGKNITTDIDCSLIFNLEKNEVANFKVLGVSRIWSDE